MPNVCGCRLCYHAVDNDRHHQLTRHVWDAGKQDQAHSQWTHSVYNEWYVSCCVSLQQDDSDGGSDNEGQDGEASGTHSKGHHVHNMSCHTQAHA